MNANNLIYQLKPPCSKCLYKLGQVQTLVTPCPQCKENGYQTFERFWTEIHGCNKPQTGVLQTKVKPQNEKNLRW